MADTKLNDYPARLGDKQWVIVDHTGPASYTTGGETLGNANAFTGVSAQGLGSIDAVLPGAGVSVSGNYTFAAQPTGAGSRKTWNLLWYYAAAASGVTGVTSSGGSGMTAGTYALAFSGGGGSGAAGTITVTTSAVTNITVTNPGSGYATPPAVTAATGGTPPTLTATIGGTAGTQVSSTTNLSAETVRIGYVGR